VEGSNVGTIERRAFLKTAAVSAAAVGSSPARRTCSRDRRSARWRDGGAAQLQAGGFAPANGAVYPDTDLGHALTDATRLINANVGLQVAALYYRDSDMHAGMGDVDGRWMVDHLTELSASLAPVANDLGPAGMSWVNLGGSRPNVVQSLP
jgi:hypothetical protein